MADSPWDDKLKAFLKKTSVEFKRFSVEVKDEAQKLMADVQDPQKQQALREGLKEVGTWARKTAEEVATVVEDGVKKAEVVIGRAQEKVEDFIATPAPPPASTTPTTPQPTPPSPPPVMDEAAPAAPSKPRKTVGRKPVTSPQRAKKASPRKTIGPTADDGEE